MVTQAISSQCFPVLHCMNHPAKAAPLLRGLPGERAARHSGVNLATVEKVASIQQRQELTQTPIGA
jgi:hypothetical protein